MSRSLVIGVTCTLALSLGLSGCAVGLQTRPPSGATQEEEGTAVLEQFSSTLTEIPGVEAARAYFARDGLARVLRVSLTLAEEATTAERIGEILDVTAGFVRSEQLEYVAFEQSGSQFDLTAPATEAGVNSIDLNGGGTGFSINKTWFESRNG